MNSLRTPQQPSRGTRATGALAAGLALLTCWSAGVGSTVQGSQPPPRVTVKQVAEPGTVTRPTLLTGNGPSAAPLDQEICEPGARWLRVRVSELVLKGGDSLTLTGSEGGRLRLSGEHWTNRVFSTRALPGSCVQLSAELADPASRFSVNSYQYGTQPLRQVQVVVAGAGDMCGSGSSCDETSDVIVALNPASVFTAGDNAYPNGTLQEHNQYYDPNWGRFKSKTRPSAGNHEYNTSGAAGYFDYFNGVGQPGGPAGERGKGYYSYDVGDWHLIALNSNVSMSSGSVQEQWLRQDLQANTKPCTLAYWHHARFSRGSHGSSTAPQPLWQALYDNKADVVVSGHDHNYQRFAPQTPAGVADPVNGIRQFVVGTGGISHYSFNQSAPNFEVGNTDTYGVLKLTLSATGYTWDFLPIAGGTFTDSGSGTCHNATPTPDFSLGLSPGSLSVAQGGSGTSTATVASTGGFASAVSLTASGLPSGVTASFSPNPVTPPANGSATSTLTLTASASAPVGTSNVTVTGTSGSLSHGANLGLTVTGTGGDQSAAFDATLQAPKCGTVGRSCDSGTLLLGRAGLGPEPNQPNTINDSCTDGTSGTFHSDESNDRIKVSTTDGSTFAPGKTVRIDATVWAWTTPSADHLDLYYAANGGSPSWTFITTLTPSAAGSQVLSATYTLPAGTLQAVRARLRYQGSAAACGTGSYNDHDDLIFAVGGAPPSEVVFEDNLETSKGWTTNPNGTDTATTGRWERGDPEETSSSGVKQLGTTVSGVNDLVTGRLAGSSAGADDIDGGVTSIQSPAITLPTGNLTLLSFSYYLAHGSNASSADFLRVKVVGSTSQTVFERLGAAANVNGAWASASVSLNAFAGQTVRLLIEAADAGSASLVEAAIDDVKITRQ